MFTFWCTAGAEKLDNELVPVVHIEMTEPVMYVTKPGRWDDRTYPGGLFISYKDVAEHGGIAGCPGVIMKKSIRRTK